MHPPLSVTKTAPNHICISLTCFIYIYTYTEKLWAKNQYQYRPQKPSIGEPVGGAQTEREREGGNNEEERSDCHAVFTQHNSEGSSWVRQRAANILLRFWNKVETSCPRLHWMGESWTKAAFRSSLHSPPILSIRTAMDWVLLRRTSVWGRKSAFWLFLLYIAGGKR